MKRWLISIIAAVALMCAASADAQFGAGSTTRILVGFPPGQATDLVARMLAERLTIALGHPVIVAGKMRLLAVGTRERLPAFPDTPTIGESGYPGFEAVAWVGLSAPAGTPLAVREQISAEVQKIVRSPEFAQRLVALGGIPRPSTIDAMAALLRSEDKRWKKIVAQSGAKVD